MDSEFKQKYEKIISENNNRFLYHEQQNLMLSYLQEENELLTKSLQQIQLKNLEDNFKQEIKSISDRLAANGRAMTEIKKYKVNQVIL